ncbi:hypothetical protein [Comamonas sp. JC664]|uniref:hypothetical protein n=1 Tax=Comamonas sp. JC664 TaxID=2801917 RepID=UPI001749AEA6|nr:hypothetical protein [Comamonas sp. JC664]MBL0694045.1 hypothetical protein [Comamonas sp. JC664]GHG75527.1 hypothetical protein GCM10012319_23740 [Comamonas sp. KCTC 72670]
MSGLSRILALALLLLWQTVASGAAGLGHYCEKQVQRKSSVCKCPHGAVHSEAAARGEPVLHAHCCDAPHWDLPAPTEAGSASHAPLIHAPHTLVPAVWLPSPPAPPRPLPAFARWEVPQGQGPPVYLRVRTLLI